MNITPRSSVCSGMLLCSIGLHAQHLQLELNFWRPNDGVYAIVVDSLENVAYIGGDFTALTDPQPPYTTVARDRVAAIDLATGAPLPWAPVVNSQVQCLAVSATTVYIGGSFSAIDGVPRYSLGAVDKLSGLVTGWAPAPPGTSLRAMALAGGQLFIGGQFLYMAGEARQNAASFHVATGALAGWNPDANDLVVSLMPKGGTIHLGGFFTMLGWDSIAHLGLCDTVGGAITGNPPAVNMPVRGMAWYGSTLYIAGDFTQVNGQARPYAAALANGSTVTSWDPQPDAPVVDISVANGTIYLAGQFTSINGTSRPGACGVDPTAAGLVPWPPSPTGTMMVLATSGDRLYTGGVFTSIQAFSNGGRFATFVPEPPAVVLQVHALLGGPAITGTQLMYDSLRAGGLLPTVEPYGALGYTYVHDTDHPMASTSCGGYGAMLPWVMGTTGSNATVDWVVVEVRDAGDPTQLVASKRAVLRASGAVVDINGALPRLPAPPGNYHVVLRHRNHLGVMTAVPVTLSSTTVNSVNFRSSNFATFGVEARRIEGSTAWLWPGDVTFDGQVKYFGTGNDRDPILMAVGGVPTAMFSGGYHQEDVNLDGVVKYVGAGNDRDPILTTGGGNTPTNTRSEQLP